MITAAYEYNQTPQSRKIASRARYRRPVAVVFGEERGVPFRLVFKSLHAAERLARHVFGAQLIAL